MTQDAQRDLLLRLYRTALLAVDGRRRVRAALAGPQDGATLWVLAVGKAAAAMTLGALDAYGPSLTRALVISRPGHFDPELSRIPSLTCVGAGHPLPDEQSLAAGQAARQFAAEAPPGQRVLLLVSGGASSLIELLPEGVGLEDLRRIVSWALANGVDIAHLNAMRRRLSLVKDGRLAGWFAHCAARGLVISDVPGDDPALVGSGLLKAGVSGPAASASAAPAWPAWAAELASAAAVPAAGPLAFGVDVVARMDDALAAAERAGLAAGLIVERHAARIDGDAIEVARAVTLDLATGSANLHLWGGEPTVRLPPAPGRGGRAQHLALAAARWIAGHDGLCLLAAGTDGTDGNTEDAGALVDAGTVDRGGADGLDPDDFLRRADSGTFLEDS
ncbi:MAG: DUF4147 domain-containing protein, partial [Steroidobacteraceae bacterium]|nr:DUF4147 domain-containing protein [Steroidobacteraceae bacterium]